MAKVFNTLLNHGKCICHLTAHLITSKCKILKWLIFQQDSKKTEQEVVTKTSVLVDQEAEKWKGSH